MGNKRHCFAVLASIFIAALAAAGCSEAGSDGNAADKLLKERGAVSVVVQDRGAVASSEGSYADNRWTRWIRDNGPVEVDFVPVLRSESKKLLSVMFASGSAPDIINETNAPFRNNLYEQGQLLPLDDLLVYMPNYVRLLEEYPELRQAGTKSDGKLYEIGRVNEAGPLHVLFIRKDWLEALGLEKPKTTEELLEVAVAFARQDPDRNGIDDTYGINMSYHSEGAVNELFGIQQEHSWGLRDGRVVRQWDKELVALAFKKELYDRGAIDPGYISDKDGAKAKKDFLSGKLGIYVNYSMNWFEFTTRDLVALKRASPEAAVEVLEYPVSPFGSYTGAIDNPIQMTTVFNADTKDPVAAARYVDFILEPHVSELLLKGEEGVHWVRGDNGCPVITDDLKWRTEVGYSGAGAYGLFLSRGTEKCNLVAYQFNPADEMQRQGLELYLAARELYLDPAKEYPGLTFGDHVPGLPAPLDEIRTSTLKTITDLYVKAIVSGESYGAEEAIRDAQDVWEREKGGMIVDYMNKWYEENKATALLADDLRTFVEKQRRLAGQ
ncbi:extracellular solute-binding protein [Paenibacillus tarimensis]